MKLYTYFQSGASYRVRIALNLKGMQADMVYVNLLKGEQRAGNYASVNPQKLVPSLIDSTHTLTQSLAIMEYLEETHPQPPILPQDPAARCTRALALAIACDTSPLGNLKVRNYLKDELGQSKEAIGEWMKHWIADGLSAFERMLTQSGHFCYGDTPTIADCCLMPQIFSARRFECDLAPYSTIMRIAQACENHPAFIAAHPAKQADAQ